jgi:hypothetical protein
LFEKGVLTVGAENVMTVFDLVDDGGEFPVQSLVEAGAENLIDAVGRQTPQTDFTAAPEDPVNGGVEFENEVPAVLDLSDGVEARPAHLAAFFL